MFGLYWRIRTGLYELLKAFLSIIFQVNSRPGPILLWTKPNTWIIIISQKKKKQNPGCPYTVPIGQKHTATITCNFLFSVEGLRVFSA